MAEDGCENGVFSGSRLMNHWVGVAREAFNHYSHTVRQLPIERKRVQGIEHYISTGPPPTANLTFPFKSRRGKLISPVEQLASWAVGQPASLADPNGSVPTDYLWL